GLLPPHKPPVQHTYPLRLPLASLLLHDKPSALPLDATLPLLQRLGSVPGPLGLLCAPLAGLGPGSLDALDLAEVAEGGGRAALLGECAVEYHRVFALEFAEEGGELGVKGVGGDV